MRQIGLDEIKRIEFNMLLELQKVCDQYGLRLFLVGGSLLGAVRHQGFIPWDDDIDVGLPRPDYERLIQLYCEKKIFPDYIELQCFEKRTCEFPFMKLFDKRTKIEQKYSEGTADSIWIDVLPVDGYPEDFQNVEKQVRKVKKYRTGLMLKFAKLGEGKSQLKRLAKPFLKFCLIPFSPNWFNQRIVSIAQKYPYESSKYVGILTWGLYGVGERMLKSEFEKVDGTITFEGKQFPRQACWDSYLSNLYGNYMQLPPESKRVTHDMQAWIDD